MSSPLLQMCLAALKLRTQSYTVSGRDNGMLGMVLTCRFPVSASSLLQNR